MLDPLSCIDPLCRPHGRQQDQEAIVEAAREGNLQEVRRLVQQDRELLDATWRCGVEGT
jgi:hypothetical protein